MLPEKKNLVKKKKSFDFCFLHHTRQKKKKTMNVSCAYDNMQDCALCAYATEGDQCFNVCRSTKERCKRQTKGMFFCTQHHTRMIEMPQGIGLVTTCASLDGIFVLGTSRGYILVYDTNLQLKEQIKLFDVRDQDESKQTESIARNNAVSMTIRARTVAMFSAYHTNEQVTINVEKDGTCNVYVDYQNILGPYNAWLEHEDVCLLATSFGEVVLLSKEAYEILDTLDVGEDDMYFEQLFSFEGSIFAQSRSMNPERYFTNESGLIELSIEEGKLSQVEKIMTCDVCDIDTKNNLIAAIVRENDHRCVQVFSFKSKILSELCKYKLPIKETVYPYAGVYWSEGNILVTDTATGTVLQLSKDCQVQYKWKAHTHVVAMPGVGTLIQTEHVLALTKENSS
jgi:hypothetical protein